MSTKPAMVGEHVAGVPRHQEWQDGVDAHVTDPEGRLISPYSRVVADIAARDAIPLHTRLEGMRCYLTSTNLTYRLRGGVANIHWQLTTEGVVTSDVDPTATDDEDIGFSVGMRWVTTTANEERHWLCLDASAGAAHWYLDSDPRYSTILYKFQQKRAYRYTNPELALADAGDYDVLLPGETSHLFWVSSSIHLPNISIIGPPGRGTSWIFFKAGSTWIPELVTCDAPLYMENMLIHSGYINSFMSVTGTTTFKNCRISGSSANPDKHTIKYDTTIDDYTGLSFINCTFLENNYAHEMIVGDAKPGGTGSMYFDNCLWYGGQNHATPPVGVRAKNNVKVTLNNSRTWPGAWRLRRYVHVSDSAQVYMNGGEYHGRDAGLYVDSPLARVFMSGVSIKDMTGNDIEITPAGAGASVVAMGGECDFSKIVTPAGSKHFIAQRDTQDGAYKIEMGGGLSGPISQLAVDGVTKWRVDQDGKLYFLPTAPAHWAGGDASDALNRIASLLYGLNGNTPIP